MNSTLSVNNVTKLYGNTPVLKNVSFELDCGKILGLLGINGAGKTTLLKLLAGLLQPTEGEILLFGQNPCNQSNSILKKVGIMIETPVFYPHLTARQNLEIHLSYMEMQADIPELLDQVGLIGVENKPVSQFSLGMKQRLGIARAISHQPKLLLLDEPINGLDPVAIQQMRSLFLQLKEKGVTILLFSHILQEIFLTVEELAIISHQNFSYLGNMMTLKQKYDTQLEEHLITMMR